MPGDQPTVIFIVGDVCGFPCPERQKYLVAYDPDGRDGFGLFRTHENPSRAKIFSNKAEALATYRKQSTVRPLRNDGEPNCPMTAFTVQILPLTVAISDFRQRMSEADA